MQKLNIMAAAVLLAFILAFPAAALERAGTVERQKGSATRIQDGDAVALSEGSAVYAGDTIETGDGGRLIVRFIDSSTLQMGANAKLTVDELVYDVYGLTGAKDGQALTFVEGVFRFVSGAISKGDYTSVAIDTPVATIGIRGTDFVAGRLTVGMAPGTSHYGYQIRDGAIDVIAPGGTVTLDAPGEGTFLPFNRVAAPTPVRQWTAEEAKEADDLLAF